MALTDNNDFSVPAEGQADWDTDLSGNWGIIDRGYHAKLTAAEAIVSGDVLWVASGALAWRYDAASIDLKEPWGMSWKSVNSGENVDFLRMGVVGSVGTWSGFITPGEPVFVDPASPGFPVNSYSAAAFPIGIALADDTILVSPGQKDIRESLTFVTSLGEKVVGSAHFYSIDVGHAGYVREVQFLSSSVDAWSGIFYSGSAQVSSEQLFDIGSTSVGSIAHSTRSMWAYQNTDIASPGLLFGTVTVESGSGVGSGHVNVVIHAERLR